MSAARSVPWWRALLDGGAEPAGPATDTPVPDPWDDLDADVGGLTAPQRQRLAGLDDQPPVPRLLQVGPGLDQPPTPHLAAGPDDTEEAP
jgi:hypothetical protein